MTNHSMNLHTFTDQEILEQAQSVLLMEAEAIQALGSRLNKDFVAAHHLLINCQGRVVISGMGKSGHIGKKIASSLASTGTPSFFMHPAEASHGDLGMILPNDVLVALSNSGESEELLTIVPLLKRRGTKVLSITGNSASRLAQIADVHINAGVEREACPHNLAPTTSTTAVLALGDALTVTLLRAKGFSANDFARTHPGGSLGKRLLLSVNEIMHTGQELPVNKLTDSLITALKTMSEKALGLTAIVDEHNTLLGIFTDGDLRRTLEKSALTLHELTMGDVMTINPISVYSGALAVDAAELMQSKKIFGICVLNDQKQLIGAFNMHDLLRAGIV
ncbi:KpsF/GutQ family sugar-phosphate isomerase [Ferrovum sp. PN-J185]|uniref:KpsF/GutQ family sugar-phosphate isomerase n=2 Tax=Ferrovum sp. PN-J185 TaxID=1356306 RepID=UPI00079B2738|nr:KpsF/GutQ family sugar-phosphate isomerase [Ferrovum sp. PN-J185]KXW56026.1 arabinose 5-phosphate isomerase KdsD [Ferrovum sp. PN-J185]MCC6068262.1 KpsF/GutQ family sugar-phosphate isomerase [Ferrovum sp. PN-J185]